MMDARSRREIAERLRKLLPAEDPSAIAVRLGIEEVSLRMSVDELSPFPTIDVLAAVVAYYGVDPSYLLTGEYDVATHRKLVDADKSVIVESLQHYTRHSSGVVISRPTPERGSSAIAQDSNNSKRAVNP
jgi:hypothetical protein